MKELLAQTQQNLGPEDGILIACSGGPDSQCLLDAFGKLKPQLQNRKLLAMGIDHGLRPEAPAELDMAQALAQSHGIPFIRHRVDVPRDGNLLANAREQRYRALREVAKNQGITVIATGHTATDQAETVLFYLARGAGPKAVSGMRNLEYGVFRPLLSIRREATIAYAVENNIDFARDPSNEDSHFTRVALRHSVVPALESIVPKAVMNIHFASSLVAEDDAYLNASAQEHLSKATGVLGSLRLYPISTLPPPILRRVLLCWIESHQVALDRSGMLTLFDAVAAGTKRWSLSASREATLRINADHLWCERATEGFNVPLQLNHCSAVPNLPASVKMELQDPIQGAVFAKNLRKKRLSEVAFDADQLHLELEMRSWRKNDKIRPFGSDGHTTLGDLFTNAKIPVPLRSRWPLVVSKAMPSEILWVPGLKRSAQAPITAKTERCIVLNLDGAIWPQKKK